MKDEEIRKAVRERYAGIATGGKKSSQNNTPDTDCCSPQQSAGPASCCAPEEAVDAASCCAPQEVVDATSCCAPQEAASCCSPQDAASQAIGYSGAELGAIPEGANMGLGCGNPTAIASLEEGEVVLDLGSGGGIDCFLAANIVGETGRVIGVDMTPEMLEKARENARKVGYENVEFRLGEIENLPAADNSVDVVISNCVINLSPDKSRVFKEAHRVLKPGGRVMVSDVVLTRELPEDIKNSIAAYTGCVAGAYLKEDYLATIAEAGFDDVSIVSEQAFGSGELAGAILSVSVRAVKPNSK